MILVICTHVRLYRDSLGVVLAREDDLDVRDTAASADECIGAVRGCGADMVLLDAGAPDALDALARLTRLRPGPRVVVLGLPEDEAAVVAYAEGGVSAYVTRDDSVQALVETLRAAERGEMRCSSRMAGILVRRVAKLAAEQEARAPAMPPVHLTRRELEIAALMDAGLHNKQIAQRLQIQLPTVKNHVHHILGKLDVGGRGEATAALRARGLIV
jgi:two-component system, NarL family, nitrate/nitrite response regulator NarL